MRGVVSFVGAGPGAADLITLRGAARIASADVVLYSPALVDPAWLREHTRADADLVDNARLTAAETQELYRRVGSRLGSVACLVPGDPALTPDLRDQREACEKLGLDVEVVPGVSPVSATAAATGTTLVEPGADTLVVVEGVEGVRALATAARTLVVHAPAARAADLAEALLAAGLAADLPVTVSYKVSWPSETVLRTTIADLAADVKRANLWRNAHFLIGDTARTATPRPGYRPAARADDASEAPARWTARARRPRPAGEPARRWTRAAVEPTPEPGTVATVPEPAPEPAAPESQPAPEPAPKPDPKPTAKKPATRGRAATRRTARKS
ncbi:SAM-dependent methyltransferase [Actinokineospora sp. G85]|uniref:SAM-dependent methyltransferase n=1 Tax=Actinokineospora sp. G85 TaxID=3406626 RepID=UPI003C71CC8F